MRQVIEDLRRIAARLEELASSLKPVESCYPVYKWVLNKAGRKYYYWYLHCYDEHGFHSIYLGKAGPGYEEAASRSISAVIKTISQATNHILQAIALLEAASQELKQLETVFEAAKLRLKQLEEEAKEGRSRRRKKRAAEEEIKIVEQLAKAYEKIEPLLHP